MAAPPYTVSQGIVIDGTTSQPVANSTGVLRVVAGGALSPMYDLLGNPILSVPSNIFGVFSPFGMDIARGVLDFGGLALPVVSNEAQDALPVAVEARAAAQAAQAAALAAQAAAEDAAAGTVPGGGVDGGTFDNPSSGDNIDGGTL